MQKLILYFCKISNIQDFEMNEGQAIASQKQVEVQQSIEIYFIFLQDLSLNQTISNQIVRINKQNKILVKLSQNQDEDNDDTDNFIKQSYQTQSPFCLVYMIQIMLKCEYKEYLFNTLGNPLKRGALFEKIAAAYQNSLLTYILSVQYSDFSPKDYFQFLNEQFEQMQRAKALDQVEKSLQRNKEFKGKVGKICKDSIATAVYLYTVSYFYQEINRMLRQNQITYKDGPTLKLASLLFNTLNEFPNFIGTVYRGMRDFRFSQHYQEGSCFCWKAFTSSSQKCLKQYVGEQGSSIAIRSYNGKAISSFSCFPNEKQVLFKPGTYFVVDKILVQDDRDQIQLTQLSSPSFLCRQLILIVRDEPANPSLWENQKQSEILQIPTRLFKHWIREFCHIIIFKSIKLRIIFDLGQFRKESHLSELFSFQQTFRIQLKLVKDSLRKYKNLQKQQCEKHQYNEEQKELKKFTQNERRSFID